MCWSMLCVLEHALCIGAWSKFFYKYIPTCKVKQLLGCMFANMVQLVHVMNNNGSYFQYSIAIRAGEYLLKIESI